MYHVYEDSLKEGLVRLFREPVNQAQADELRSQCSNLVFKDAETFVDATHAIDQQYIDTRMARIRGIAGNALADAMSSPSVI